MSGKRFEGRVAIVIGASMGIGRSTVLQLASEGAQAICFLGSDDASFITGVILPVDGGKSPQMYVPSFDITNLDNQAEDR